MFEAALPSSPVATVLLVEDDTGLRREMARYLQEQGYAVRQAETTKTAHEMILAEAIDVVVLDVRLPGEDGLSLCRRLAGKGGPAILMLSAMGEPVDRILGLELGADGYVAKPISPRELLARVRALLRRRGEGVTKSCSAYSFAGFHLDLQARQLKAPNGIILVLTQGELKILSALLDNPRSVLPREALFRAINDDAGALGRGVDLHISRLRRKINSQLESELIKTYRGVGYVLDASVEAR